MWKQLLQPFVGFVDNQRGALDENIKNERKVIKKHVIKFSLKVWNNFSNIPDKFRSIMPIRSKERCAANLIPRQANIARVARY